MATTRIYANYRGSGTNNYTAYQTILHLGSGYRMVLSFDVSVIPANATVTACSLSITRADNTMQGVGQQAVIKASSSKNWSYTSTDSITKTPAIAGTRRTYDISALASNVGITGVQNLHLSTSNTLDTTYLGSMSNGVCTYVWLDITYETGSTPPTPDQPLGDSGVYRFNGALWQQVRCHVIQH